MQNTKIGWCHHTANLWIGCQKVANHPGCQNCYAERFNNRFRKEQNLWGGPQRLFVQSAINNCLKWQQSAEKEGTMLRVFVGSNMDVFEKPMPLVASTGEHTGQNTGHIRTFFFEEIIPQCPNLLFLLLTKRPSNINKMIPEGWLSAPPTNVMFGSSASDYQTFKNSASHLAKVKGKRFMSVEPQIAPIWLNSHELTHLHWIIQGGESGPKKRPFDIDWAYSMSNVCRDNGVPYFFKQIDGQQPRPQELIIEQFPAL